jgi:hypothetical protein
VASNVATADGAVIGLDVVSSRVVGIVGVVTWFGGRERNKVDLQRATNSTADVSAATHSNCACRLAILKNFRPGMCLHLLVLSVIDVTIASRLAAAQYT